MAKKFDVYIPMHGCYPLNNWDHEDKAVKVPMEIIADFWEFIETGSSDKEAESKVKEIIESLPEDQRLTLYGDRYWGMTIYKVSATMAKHRQMADYYAAKMIPVVYESGGDGTHFDEIPSAVEEFIYYCQKINYLAPIQRLYASLWQGPPVHLKEKPNVWGNDDDNGNWYPVSAYYPLEDDDPGLHTYFEIEGINLHSNHPRD